MEVWQAVRMVSVATKAGDSAAEVVTAEAATVEAVRGAARVEVLRAEETTEAARGAEATEVRKEVAGDSAAVPVAAAVAASAGPSRSSSGCLSRSWSAGTGTSSSLPGRTSTCRCSPRASS